MKRKYARTGDREVAYECTKKKCKWQGFENERPYKDDSEIKGMRVATCPKCGNDTFYGLIEFNPPTK